METLFEFIPSELIIIILSYLDEWNLKNLSNLSNNINNLLKEKSTWVLLLISEYRYEYQLLRDIDEDSIENIKDFYYKLKEGEVYYRNNHQGSMIIGSISPPYLVKILLYNNYPRIYNLLSQLINSESYTDMLGRITYLGTYKGLFRISTD